MSLFKDSVDIKSVDMLYQIFVAVKYQYRCEPQKSNIRQDLFQTHRML